MSMYISMHLSMHMSVHMSLHIFMHIFMHVSMHMPVRMSSVHVDAQSDACDYAPSLGVDKFKQRLVV